MNERKKLLNTFKKISKNDENEMKKWKIMNQWDDLIDIFEIGSQKLLKITELNKVNLYIKWFMNFMII